MSLGSLNRRVPGLGDAGDSVQLQMVKASVRAVHMDVATGRPTEQAQADLAKAATFANSISPTSPEFPVAQTLLNEAERDVENLQRLRSQAASAAVSFNSATGAQQDFFARGGQPIDVGGGSALYDAFGGTISDLTLGKVRPSYAEGLPGDYAPRGAVEMAADERTCELRGGRWDPLRRECIGGRPMTACDLLPDPVAWACRNPGKATALGLGVVAAPWIVPWFVRLVTGTYQAVQA